MDEPILILPIISDKITLCPVCNNALNWSPEKYRIRIHNEYYFCDLLAKKCPVCQARFGTIEMIRTIAEKLILQNIISRRDEAIYYRYTYETKKQKPPIELKSRRPALDCYPPHTVLIIRYSLLGENRCKELLLVDNWDEQSTEAGIYHVERSFSQSLIRTILDGEKSFQHKDKTCIIKEVKEIRVIRFYVKKDPIDSRNPLFTRDRLTDNFMREHNNPLNTIIEKCAHPYELVDVGVYRAKRPCQDHIDFVKTFSISMMSLHSNALHPMIVHYCYLCDEYYVNYRDYFSFCRCYGLPPLRLYDLDDKNRKITPYKELKAESILHLYGYSVAGGNIYDRNRQNLLGELIDLGLISKEKIVSHLEWLITFNGANPMNYRAVPCWKEDLKFVKKYKTQFRNDIIGRFTAGRHKKLQ